MFIGHVVARSSLHSHMPNMYVNDKVTGKLKIKFKIMALSTPKAVEEIKQDKSPATDQSLVGAFRHDHEFAFQNHTNAFAYSCALMGFRMLLTLHLHMCLYVTMEICLFVLSCFNISAFIQRQKRFHFYYYFRIHIVVHMSRCVYVCVGMCSYVRLCAHLNTLIIPTTITVAVMNT